MFIAFALPYVNGKDLRTLPLIGRKAMLKKLLQRKRSRVLYLDHVEGDGRLFFEQIVKRDLEGIVCKQKDSPYKVTEKPSRYWIKVKNSRYSHWKGVKSFLSACRKNKYGFAVLRTSDELVDRDYIYSTVRPWLHVSRVRSI